MRPDSEHVHDGYATPKQAREAIEKLKEGDFSKLMIIAERYWRSRRLRAASGEPEDLLQEALTRTLESDRRWCRSVSMQKHLAETMRSISGGLARRGKLATATFQEQTRLFNEACDGPELDVEAQDELQPVAHFFGEDREGLELFVCRVKEMTASQIRSHLGIDQRRYETLSKRVRRKLIEYQRKLSEKR